jgi:hypothetical protein
MSGEFRKQWRRQGHLIWASCSAGAVTNVVLAVRASEPWQRWLHIACAAVLVISAARTIRVLLEDAAEARSGPR